MGVNLKDCESKGQIHQHSYTPTSLGISETESRRKDEYKGRKNIANLYIKIPLFTRLFFIQLRRVILMKIGQLKNMFRFN